MRKLLAALAGTCLFTATLYAIGLNIDPNQSGSIALSSNPAVPTQIFVKDYSATKTCVVNNSTNTVYFVGYSTSSALSISTNAVVSISQSTGSFSLAGTLVNSTTVQAATFCFDGANDSFTGPLWAVTSGTSGSLQRVRMH